MSSIEDKVCEKIQERSDVGKSKYGVTMERTDLSTIEWLTHLQEELMDAAVYLERLLGDLSAAMEEIQKEEPAEEPHGFSEICMDCGSLTCTC